MNFTETPGFLVTKLARDMSTVLDQCLKKYDITISQWSVLKLLWRREGCSQVEIQEFLGLEAATVTGLIQRIQRAGLIHRSPDPQDKRVQRIYLTEQGRALEALTDTIADQVSALALQGFSADEEAFFIRLLIRARRNLADSSQ